MSDFEDELTGDDEGQFVALLVERVPLGAPPPELIAFVEGTLQDCFTAAGKTGTKRWCTLWAEHPDAVHRLAAIYDEYTLMLTGGKGVPSLHIFIREVIDYHLPYLVDREFGAFRLCDSDGHTGHQRLEAASAEGT
jgi:hypothetical protein